MKVKACPFCGNHRVNFTVIALEKYYQCLDCNTLGPSGNDAGHALALWNNRPGENQLGYQTEAYLQTK